MKRISLLLVFLVFAATLPLLAQQKGQYVPGQYGLNAGVLPDPGFTYANFEINYDTNTINNSSGTAVSPKPRLNLKGTSASLFTDWEVHGQRQGTTYKTPGQAFTDEWGLGQALPLRKDMSKLIQLGVIGYDQWQVTDNGGNVSTTLPNGTVVIAPASLLPRYSVHAVGGQANFIMPPKNIVLYFKYEHEYTAYAHTLGNTIVFGGSWTLKIP